MRDEWVRLALGQAQQSIGRRQSSRRVGPGHGHSYTTRYVASTHTNRQSTDQNTQPPASLSGMISGTTQLIPCSHALILHVRMDLERGMQGTSAERRQHSRGRSAQGTTHSAFPVLLGAGKEGCHCC